MLSIAEVPGSRASYRQTLGLTDNVPEIEYLLLKSLPSLLGLKEKQVQHTLDIVSEQYIVTYPGSSVTITVKSLGHSQFACADYAVGSRFGAHPTILMLHDMGNRSSVWFEHMQVALSLYDAGFDLLWFDVEDFRSDPGQLSLIFNKFLRQLLVHLGIRRAMTFSAGFGAGIFLELLLQGDIKLFETMHFMLNPDTQKNLGNLTEQLRSHKVLLWSTFWNDVTRPGTGNAKTVLNSAAVTLQVERNRLLAAKRAAKTFDSVIVGQFQTQLWPMQIREDTLNRQITVLNAKLVKSITAFFTEGREGFINLLEDHFLEGNTLLDHLKAKQQHKQLQQAPLAPPTALVLTQKSALAVNTAAPAALTASASAAAGASASAAVAAAGSAPAEQLRDPTYDEESEVVKFVQDLSKETAAAEFKARDNLAKVRSRKDAQIAEKVDAKLLEKAKVRTEEDAKVQQALRERGQSAHA